VVFLFWERKAFLKVRLPFLKFRDRCQLLYQRYGPT
jgi:hypothetical protein